jgi:glycerol-3-phosphate acyltransferase PlsX
MRIAVDAMGGDNAPREIVKGALAAARDINGDLILVGKPAELQGHLPKTVPSNVYIHPAADVIEMNEPPLEAIRRKKDSSLAVAVRLVAERECDAVVSAGNTGAATGLAKVKWKMIPGINRPAIATTIPSRAGHFILLDSGATPDCSAADLVDFAIMGSAYAAHVMGTTSPRIGLLNIGEEAGKGNQLVKRAHALMQERVEGFIGNVEGRHVFSGNVDVVVCDAFVGNIVLKTGEALAEMMVGYIKESLPKNFLLRLPLPLLLGGLVSLKRKVDYSEYGGAPLLGVNGVLIICHGRSDQKAIRNAVRCAATAAEQHLCERIEKMAASADRGLAHA